MSSAVPGRILTGHELYHAVCADRRSPTLYNADVFRVPTGYEMHSQHINRVIRGEARHGGQSLTDLAIQLSHLRRRESHSQANANLQ